LNQRRKFRIAIKDIAMFLFPLKKFLKPQLVSKGFKCSLLKLFMVFTLLFVIPTFSNAQFLQEWVSVYDRGDDEACVITNDDNFIYQAGTGIDTVMGTGVVVVMKYNKAGTLIWDFRYTKNFGVIIPRKIIVDKTGNIYVTCMKSTPMLYDNDIYTFKLNSAGSLKWINGFSLDSNSRDDPESMFVDASGNVFVTGSCGHNSEMQVLTIKYNSQGRLQWFSRFNSTPYEMHDSGFDILTDLSGNSYVAAQCCGFGSNADAVLLKYNTEGELLWYRRIDYNSGGDLYEKMVMDVSSRIYIVGYSFGNSLLTIYNTNGDLLKLKRFLPNGGNNFFLTDCKLDKWNNLYASGKINYPSNGDDMAVIKYDPQGNVLWSRSYDCGLGLEDFSNGLAVDRLGNCFIVGTSTVSSPFYYVARSLCYDASGTQKWVATYSGTDSLCRSKGIVVDSASSIYISCSSTNNTMHTGPDIALIKYSVLAGINPGNNTTPLNYSLHQNRPNPFNPVTKIKFDVAKQGVVSINVFDITGREVKSLVNNNYQPGVYEVDFNGSGLSSGVYFYRMISGEFTGIKRMILLK
jgi:hypothetical protein